ncbi:MAG: hypothetical protein QW140_00025 [Candidatus Aenigmatarchaeota archaeon]
MRKGQTALEYLMTYGWAILIVIIVVAALYALGLTKPCRWTGTQIREFADFKVDNPLFKVGSAGSGSLEFDLSYIKPTSAELISINVTGSGTGSYEPTTQTPLTSTPERYTIDLSGVNIGGGDCYSVEVTIYYNVTVAGGQEVTYSTAGKISGVAS